MIVSRKHTWISEGFGLIIYGAKDTISMKSLSVAFDVLGIGLFEVKTSFGALCKNIVDI